MCIIWIILIIFGYIKSLIIFLVLLFFAHFFSVHPVYSYSKSVDTHTRVEIPTARVRRKKPYVHWTLILNVHHWQKRGSKNVRDLRERAVLLFNGKNRRRRGNSGQIRRRMWERFYDYRDSMDRRMEPLPPRGLHWRSTVFRIFLRGPFRTCSVLHERTVNYTFISFTGQVIL